MVTFRNLPIKRKLRYAMLITAYAVLLVTLSIQTISDLLKSRSAMVSNLETLAEVIGANAEAALMFEGMGSAEKLLEGFHTAPEIHVAYLFNVRGEKVATYNRHSHPPWTMPLDELDQPVTDFSNTRLHLYRPITMDEQFIGAIYIQSDLSELYLQLTQNILLALIAALISVLLASWLSSKLQRLLARPITELADIITDITKHQKYDRHVNKFDNDEIGQLYDCFNEMLRQIKERDQRLQQHRANLESAVEERTHELDIANQGLKENIKELNEAKEAALDAAKAKSAFLANMSHEIRTPMNGVLGMLELLRDTPVNKTQQDFLDTAYSSADSLLDVINDILDFSKIEAGKMEIESIDMNASGITEDVCTLLASKARGKGLQLSCFTDVSLPRVVKGDPVRLRQVLTNLVGNAVKFTSEGEVIVRVNVLSSTDASVRVEFSVEDTGIGIAESAVPNLFSAFTQADGSTTRKFGGTGLGLTISRQLVQLMGSDMSVTSAEGLGSTFSFVLDMDISSSRQLASADISHTLDGTKALIVDDNATNRDILRHYLTAWGIEHSEVTSGQQALDELERAYQNNEPYKLAFLDMDMPGMDGLMLSKAIEQNKELRSLRRIMLSSSGFLTRTKQKEAGISACLTKPFRQSRLLDTAMQVMHDHEIKKTEPAKKRPTEQPVFAGDTRLLLVEDNIVNQKVATSMLKKIGLQNVAIAEDGKEAVSMNQQHHYDLILMDCQMPKMSGYEATGLIRQREQSQQLPRIPIIAMTANAMQGDREKCLSAGMDDYLSKPIKAGGLRKMLTQWLITEGNDKKEPSENSLPSAAITKPNVTEAPDEPDLFIDLAVFTTLKDIMEEEFSSLIDSYIGDAPGLLEDIQSSYRNADLKVLIRAAHTLKSSSSNVGATVLANQAEKIEALAKEGQLAEAGSLLPELKNILNSTMNELGSDRFIELAKFERK